jgi:serine protease Do
VSARRAAARWVLGLALASVGCRDKPSGGAAGASSAASAALPPGTPPAASVPPQLPAPGLVAHQGMPASFAPLAKRADPAVATVKARAERETPNGRRRVVTEGLGTAFVYNPDGYLLTNNHVIEDATNVRVSFFDGRDYDASVVGRDKHTDVAVLKVDQTGLPSLPLGDSDALEVGDWVVAIGNPFGLSHTVSAGILSAKGRTREDVKGLDEDGYFNFLQTDASINPGNSGGPLLNVRGDVVGINAAVRANANNIGFAIPINMVKQLLPMLLKDGKIRRSELGIWVDALNVTEAQRLRRPDRRGAWVTDVVPGSAADRASIALDDVILAFDGKPISDPNELRWLASIAGISRVVPVQVSRGGRIFDLRVTLGELSDKDKDGSDR